MTIYIRQNDSEGQNPRFLRQVRARQYSVYNSAINILKSMKADSLHATTVSECTPVTYYPWLHILHPLENDRYLFQTQVGEILRVFDYVV